MWRITLKSNAEGVVIALLNSNTSSGSLLSYSHYHNCLFHVQSAEPASAPNSIASYTWSVARPNIHRVIHSRLEPEFESYRLIPQTLFSLIRFPYSYAFSFPASWLQHFWIWFNRSRGWSTGIAGVASSFVLVR